MEEYIIKKNQTKPDAIDYQKLREYGLDYIASLGNKFWSDYNIHDPGITTLELLCYALTDLGYRTSFDIKDILTPPGGKRPDMDNSFIPAHEILSCHPLTISDYRKWMLEHIPCIRNIWFEKYNQMTPIPMKGFYRIIVDMESADVLKNYRSTFGRERNGRYATKEEYEKYIYSYCKHYIRNMFLKIRNLCEDVQDVLILNSVEVGICANIEIKSDCKYEPIIQEVEKRMNNYINPAIPLYTLTEMLEKDKPVEEIYQGYVPKLGFIDRDEMEQFENMEQLNISDAINLIMGIDGVINVRHLHYVVKDCDCKKVSITNYGSVKLKSTKKYAFRYHKCGSDETVNNSLNQYVITRGLLSFKPIFKPEENNSENSRPTEILNVELPLPTGKNRELDHYISIQDEFPKTYKIGKEGVADSETDVRKAQRLQFKAYLLFFDQLLADYLAQLNAVKDLYSWKEEKDETYLFKNLSDEEIADFSKVFSGYEANKNKGLQKYEDVIDSDAVKLDRKNRFLNHLIARFNEEFVDYSILKIMNNELEIEENEQDKMSDFDEKELIKDKSAFLRNYTSISRDRSHAFDYTEPFFDDSVFINRDINVCGLEAALYGKLGIDLKFLKKRLTPNIISKAGKIIFVDNRNGNYNNHFGLRVYEHIVMRPLPNYVSEETFLKLTVDIDQSEIVSDPYSMQITIAVPGWLTISENPEFRKFVEKVIRMEIPAHIAAKICWLNPYQMYMLEKKYSDFLNVLAQESYPKKDQAWQQKHRDSLIELVKVFSTLRSIYPLTQLYSDDSRQFINSTILNHSILGGDHHEGVWEFKSNTETT